MKYRIKTSWCLLVISLLLLSSLRVQAQKRRPPQNDKRKGHQQKTTIENLQKELGPDWEAVIINQIEKELPEEIGALQQEKQKNPQKYKKKLAKWWGDIQRLERYKSQNPAKYNRFKKRFKLDRKSHTLRQAYGETDDAERKAQIKTELKTCLSELFTFREAERAEKITELEQELARLREMMNNRQKNKDKIIEKKLGEMLAEPDLLEW